MRAEIISIGDELTSGQRLDTNSQWLSQQLADLGVQTFFQTTVGDDLQANIDAFRIAASRADIVVSSGGLGPTADDLTRESIAAAFDRELELRDEALAHIEGLFSLRKRPMPERNRVQAMFPAGSTIIPNPHGTAPGIDLIVETLEPLQRSRLFALPGVPAEMKQMFLATVIERLKSEENVGATRWFYRSLKVFGIGESDCEAMLPSLIARNRIPRVGITVSQATITLRIACLAADEESAAVQCEDTEEEIRTALGDLVFGEGDADLDEVVARTLAEKGLSLSVIEFGGMAKIGPWLARYQDASSDKQVLKYAGWFPNIEAAISSWNDHGSPVQEDVLNSNLSTSQTKVTVSTSANVVELQDGGDQWARQRSMLEKIALDVRSATDTDLCLVVGPYPELAELRKSESIPACEWTMAVINRDGRGKSSRYQLGGHPDIVHSRLAKTGLDYLRKFVANSDSE